MRIGPALAAADDWRMMIALHVNLGPQPINDMWLQAGRVAGCDFLPLTSTAAIAEEAKAMRVLPEHLWLQRGAQSLSALERATERRTDCHAGSCLPLS